MIIQGRKAANHHGAVSAQGGLKRMLVSLLLAGLLGQSVAVFGQESRPENEITSLGEGVYLFRHQFHQAIFITTPKGVIVTDPISAEAATWLKKEIKRYSDQPVRYVVYSHHHDDHITGGSLFADTALFVSQAGARAKIRDAADPLTPLPDLTFTDRMSIDLGGRHAELIYVGKNHSDNSLVVLLPEQRLLFAVDFIPVETVAYRTMKSDYPDDWIESLKRVEQLDFDRLVPGHGKIGNKEHVRMFRGYLEDLRAAVQEQLQKGASLEETKKAVQLPKYERWQRYGDWFPENVEGMYRYLTQRRETK
ncbi:MAG TPA: MBL fold metallo-hydrolase [Nitrospira sp.]|nr:MBL fold metallo-hydrolase [Nitrospira sp.]